MGESDFAERDGLLRCSLRCVAEPVRRADSEDDRQRIPVLMVLQKLRELLRRKLLPPRIHQYQRRLPAGRVLPALS